MRADQHSLPPKTLQTVTAWEGRRGGPGFSVGAAVTPQVDHCAQGDEGKANDAEARAAAVDSAGNEQHTGACIQRG